ncbi:MAG: toast rack family protein [Vicinamibacterales bacterium]
MQSLRFVSSLLLVGTAVAVSACDLPVEAGPMQSVTRSVEQGDAQAVDVELRMGAGELSVQGGATTLLNAGFQFNVPEWTPTLTYQDGPRGSLRVEQPGHGISFGDSKNIWDLKLNDSVPMALTVRLGAGKAVMSVGTLDLSSIEVHQGVGELQLDLRGMPKHSYTVRVHGGVGSASIRVPRSVAVAATARNGIGDVDVRGLVRRDDDVWVNPAHEGNPTAIQLDVRGGVGKIVIIADET